MTLHNHNTTTNTPLSFHLFATALSTYPQQQHHMRRQVGRAIGQGISPVVEGLDVDAIVQQIDIQALLMEHVDFNAILLNKIDLDALVAKIDWNELLTHHIDLDLVLAQIDISKLVERSDLESIVARASTGFVARFLHFFRQFIAYYDQWIQRILQCRYELLGRRPYLPRRPGIPSTHQDPWPAKRNQFGIAVQFRCCGSMVRVLAWIVDNFFLTLFFAFFSWVVEKLVDAIEGLDKPTSVFWAVCFFVFEMTYSSAMVATTGRTIGHFIVGILVVNHDGNHVGVLQAIYRAFINYFNILLFGWTLGLVRRDGRQLVDLCACTCIVYAWDTSPGYIIGKKTVVDRHNHDFATSIHDYRDDDDHDYNGSFSKPNRVMRSRKLSSRSDVELPFHDALPLGSLKEV